MGKYLCEEDMSTGEYISRDEALKIFHQCCDNCTSSYNGVMCRACAEAGAMDILVDIPVSDVQPLSVVAEHIKKRLYETAFNTTEEKARDAIADMAERIDFWIDELKDSDEMACMTLSQYYEKVLEARNAEKED